jgi:hypothetical protein
MPLDTKDFRILTSTKIKGSLKKALVQEGSPTDLSNALPYYGLYEHSKCHQLIDSITNR